ncbi:TadE/TadG family type IV pilus assembly protein [Trinickia fusca]|uniref:Pilus assembly protein n=1 Tax=Trinickia fusca TaxID=2419777 RepID=A0A494XRM3_9BURK|nr:TadE/TadG family type IV pilus assembly protein [Trinickia fusca]RKP52301.1 pilus assembly protein [Trinickia fusca]
MRRLPTSPRNEDGVVALEFALVLPFLMMVLFGIVDVSLMLCDKAVITNASREAARAGVVVHVPRLTSTQITNVALTYTQNSLISGGTPASPTVTVNQSSGTLSGDPLTVTVSYTYQGLFVGSALSSLTGPVTLSATTVMNYE